MGAIKSHKDLEIWKRSISLVTEIYKFTKDFPENEKFGLTNQLRRAAVSVPSNIAEGSARKSRKEFIQYLHIALGSLAEIDTQIIISKNLDYIIDTEYYLDEISSIKMMTLGLIKRLRS